ncbi:diguanylate cyclase [Viridibacillus sp. FSL R5-0477]|uniref:7TM domain sensor diguanylate cyclase n=1 Tax=Viridibacillus arenosi FSL R5-213 TaxID=1227360 RepID=W4F391_9BACL|nr:MULTISPECIES: diguanylate cyclase [Viridibacillus]ETT87318.1 7TM domain sensor diguanylate cyclase [Viridibacillus arenosi FSL R5-213]OMC87858.1 diguanylate cyclase [Viridibacillus sp. FSL H7-0596]OMC91408.1 diguanylate cyclase [Viridibacillus arenosi]
MRKISALILFVFILSGCTLVDYETNSQIKYGLLVINQTDIAESSIIPLRGEWLFFTHELLSNREIEKRIITSNVDKEYLPRTWNDSLRNITDYATFALYLKIPKEQIGHTFALSTRFQSSAYTLLVDGMPISTSGSVGTSKDTSAPSMTPKIGYFVPNSDKILVVLQVSNFEDNVGGPSEEILFGRANAIVNYHSDRQAALLFMNGSIIIIGIYHIIIFLYRKTERPFLYFGLLSLFIAVRSLFVGPMLLQMQFSHLSWFLLKRIEHTLIYGSVLVYIGFISRLFPREAGKKIVYIVIAIIMPLLLLTWVTPPSFFKSLFFDIFPLAFILMIFITIILVKAFVNKRPTALMNLIANLLFFITVVNDYLFAKGLIDTLMLSIYGFFFYVILQAFNLSRNYAKNFHESELLSKELMTLNTSLDKKIHERTYELQLKNERLKQLTELDGLTGINNRRYFEDRLPICFRKSYKDKWPLTILMIDIDEFKKYNDTYGHLKGDDLICHTVNIMKDIVADRGVISRYGGEEFAIVIRDMGEGEARILAEKIRSSVENAKFEHKGRSDIQFATISIGGTTTFMHSFESVSDFIEAADQALYQSKNSGRNQTNFL